MAHYNNKGLYDWLQIPNEEGKTSILQTQLKLTIIGGEIHKLYTLKKNN